MKKSTIYPILFAAAASLGLAACADTDAQYTIPEVDAPAIVKTTPETGADKVRRGDITVTVDYDKRVFFASKDMDQIKVSGATLVNAEVYGTSSTLTLVVNCPQREQQVTITVPEGVVTGSQGKPAPEVSLSFSTVALDKAPVAATGKALQLYNFLLENFEQKVLSGIMADVAWNTDEAEKVNSWIGKYPAVNCFDYLHMPASVAGLDWAPDYTDITPVSNWAAQGGIVAAMWHWNVPRQAPGQVISTLWEETPVAMPNDWSGTIQLTDDDSKALFADVQTGQYILVETTDVAAGAQGSFKNGGWNEIAPGTDYFDITGDFTLEVTDDVLASLQTGGLIISGHDYTATAVRVIDAPIDADPLNGYAFYADQTTFDATNALQEGTWENKIFEQDLARMAGYLTLLKEAGIPVLWRPFHEAAGGWFWWGKDAASFKGLWIRMFDYFRQQGLDNLIWVWTTEGNDSDWYPGDQYVDIVGRDLYSEETADCASQYASISAQYGNKMVALSECGTVGLISEQWASGAAWSWFMPWYEGQDEDEEGNVVPVVHADQAWWQDAAAQSYVLFRDDVRASLQ